MTRQEKIEAIVQKAEAQVMNGTYWEDVAIAAANELDLKSWEFSALFLELTGTPMSAYTEQLIEQELV